MVIGGMIFMVKFRSASSEGTNERKKKTEDRKKNGGKT